MAHEQIRQVTQLRLVVALQACAVFAGSGCSSQPHAPSAATAGASADSTVTAGTSPAAGSGGSLAHAGSGGVRGVPSAAGTQGAPAAAGSGGDSSYTSGPIEVTLNRLPEFPKPPVSVRLKTRFAAADASASFQELAKAGFGAVEMGASLGNAASLRSTLQAAKDAGISVDLAPGGSQPYVAAEITEADSMQQLSRAVSMPLMSDGTMIYRGAAPKPPSAELASSPTLKLVAVTAARVVGDASAPVVLDPDSAVDLTPMLDSSAQVSWMAPEGKWLVFGFWQRATGQTAGGYPPFKEPSEWSATVPSPGFSGYCADVLSGVGIGKALAPLAALPADTLELLRGTQFAHDSHEFEAEMFWTGKLPEEFNTRRGYAMIKYLPALHTPKEASFDPLTANWGTTPPLTPEYDFANDVGERIRYDYHLTVNDLYVGEYLKTFTDTLHQYGMSSRAQVAYNYLPLSMTRAGIAVDIPENEALDSGWTTANDPTLPMYGSERWRHAIDSYRLTGSGAHLGTGKRATIEFGDDFAIYRKQPVDYAQQLNEACAGGITMGLLTGFAGIGSGWPGSSGLAGIGIGDFWTTAWPQWRDWTQLTDYFARSTLVLETGRPQIDVVIYLDKGISGVHELTTPKFASSSLESAGYTYDFIDPISLGAPRASEVAGTLFGNGPAYRALILNDEPKLPADTAQLLLAAAKSGVAIVIIGRAPSASTGLRDASAQDAAVMQAVSELLTLPVVAQVATADDVPSALHRLGVQPAASFGESAALLSVHRKTEQDEDLWWIFNPSPNDAAVTATFTTAGTPYRLDLWNGTIERVAQWNQQDSSLSMPLTLPAHGTTAFMFQHQGSPLHATSTSAEAVSYEGDGLVLRDSHGGSKDVSLSDGSTKTLDLPVPPPAIAVRDWQLAVDEISPSGLTQHTVHLTDLKDWRDIPELKDAVGTGTYTASIDIAESLLGRDKDVTIDVGAVAGAMQLTVNTMLVTSQTTPGGSWSIGKLLKAGSNQIVVRLDTTLLNRMAQQSAATGSTLTSAPSGLLGPVQLIPVALGFVP